MATLYVAKAADSGSDSNNGLTIGAPKLTVAAALTASAAGDKIRIRKGVYTDTWPAAKVWCRDIAAYQGEDVTIDCQGTRAYVASGPLDGTGITVTGNLGIRLRDIKFLNYTTAAFDSSVNPFPTGMGASTIIDILACFWKPLTSTNTFAFDFINTGTGAIIRIERNSFVGHRAAMIGADDIESAINNAFKGNTHLAEGTIGSGTDTWPGMVFNEVDYNAYPGNAETHGINSSTSPFSFTNEGSGDYSLPNTSALRGAGKNGENIGAPFYPYVRVDSEFSDFQLSSGSNDGAYFNTGTNLPGVDGPSDAGPAVYDTGTKSVLIDNVTKPGAKSALWHLGSLTLPAGSTVTCVSWSALEDITLSSGSRQVVDFTKATGTRDIQIAINGGSRTTVTRTTLLNTPAGTIDFYMLIRADGN